MTSQEKTIIKIFNCNCIKDAEIEIFHGVLNIKYGHNGIGKTTIGKAISAKGNDDKELLNSLCPYGNDLNNEKEAPNIENMNFSVVKVFDESYVNSYLFKKDESFFEDSFRVFLRSEECEKLVLEIENLLSELQGVFQKLEEVRQLREFLPKYFSVVKFNNGEISKRGGVGEFIKGNGGGFEKYDELKSYKPFYENRKMAKVSKWAQWRIKGQEEIIDNNCPFCTDKMKMDNIRTENDIISRVFKNSALSTANAVLGYLNEAIQLGYIREESIDTLDNYMGDIGKEDSLVAELQQLAVETEYLITKIEKIYVFRPMEVKEEQLDNIEQSLEEMVIDKRQLSKFYSTPTIAKMSDEIEEKVRGLQRNTGKLKGLFKQHNSKMEKLIETRTDDINHFFYLASLPYKFKLEPSGENKAQSYLVPIDLEENRIFKAEKHLSWGERNAFSLVMFMFEALSDNADFIVLDDPVTSFDKNKKFAAMRRLFDNKKDSFANKTVLMLTHDFQPIIDYMYGGIEKGFKISTPIKARWILNEDGLVGECDIQKDDLFNAYKLTEEIAMDKEKSMPVRVVNLRKHIELMTPNFSEEPIYEVLSNLIHGRDNAKTRDGKELDEDIFDAGCSNMKTYFGDLSYDDILNELRTDKLLDIIDESDGYEKIVSLRLLFQRDDMLAKLKKRYPAACKYINETNHVENDYIFQLNPFKYFSIPKSYMDQLDEFVNSNIVRD